MNVEAVQAFKNVVSFMGDRTTRKDAGGHAQKLMKNTLRKSIGIDIGVLSTCTSFTWKPRVLG